MGAQTHETREVNINTLSDETMIEQNIRAIIHE